MYDDAELLEEEIRRLEGEFNKLQDTWDSHCLHQPGRELELGDLETEMAELQTDIENAREELAWLR